MSNPSFTTTPGDRRQEPTAAESRAVAVVDVGTNAIRMEVAEIGPGGHVRPLANYSQPVQLGHDTFSIGEIRRATIEQCVRVLSLYRRALREYQIDDSSHIRVVATSAVREARNRVSFTDRIYIATGLLVEPLDEAEVNRITYLGMYQHLRGASPIAGGKSLIVEVGGGSTELLAVQDGDVTLANSYRLGSVRLRVALQPLHAGPAETRRMMEGQIHRTVETIRDQVGTSGAQHLVALGGDVRFAATLLVPSWDRRQLVSLSLDRLTRITDQILAMRDDDLVQRYHLSYPDAETLGPALLTYVALARRLELDEVWVSDVNMRDGMLHEMSLGDVWSGEFRQQIIRFAVTLGRRFDFDESHARHVAELAGRLFEQLHELHRLEAKHEVVLYVASLLHEIGAYVNNRSLHKHSMYLIRHSELFGLGEKEQMLVALVARYHRRASPQPGHEGYSGLDREERIIVSKLAALLRIAIALDESRSGRVRDISCRIEEERVVVYLEGVDDVALEQLAVRQHGGLFEEVFGKSVLLRRLDTGGGE